MLGIAVDGAGNVYACDVGKSQVVRIEPDSGSIDVYAAGTEEQPMRAPNWLAFGPDGMLYVTDSGDWGKRQGFVWRIAAGGFGEVWTRAADRLPNGCCLALDGHSLYVIETNLPGVVRIPILPDGSAGDPAPFVELPGTVPDGCAITSDGRLLVSCQRPDGIFLVDAAGSAELLVSDPAGQMLGAPANVAFVGEELDRIVTSNLGRWHLAIADVGLSGAPLHRPLVGRAEVGLPAGTGASIA